MLILAKIETHISTFKLEIHTERQDILLAFNCELIFHLRYSHESQGKET